jgi:translation initiation factor 3 subunit I
MRPIALKGHDRPITDVVFNREGDLLFTSSKGHQFAVWYTDNGERLGTFSGHNGSVWSLAVDRHTKYVYSAGADSIAKKWDIQTGQEVDFWGHGSPVRCIKTSLGDSEFLTVTDTVMRAAGCVRLWDVRMGGGAQGMPRPIDEIYEQAPVRITRAAWGPLNHTIFLCTEDGKVRIVDRRNNQNLEVIRDHKKSIQELAWDPHQFMFLTASTDSTARLYDAHTFKPLKVYSTGRAINGASIHPYREEIMLGGGQSAESVTLTRVDSSQFKVKFFHLIFETELGSGVLGHFGPVNTLSYFPDGKGFASGGEDGFVRLYHFDPSYFEHKLC